MTPGSRGRVGFTSGWNQPRGAPPEIVKLEKEESVSSGRRRAACTLMGTAYLTQKNWKDAQTSLQKAITLDSNSADAYLALGALFNQTKNYPEAEAALLQGIKLKPNAPGGHYELAKTYWSMGRWQESAPHARPAVATMPELAAPHAL